MKEHDGLHEAAHSNHQLDAWRQMLVTAFLRELEAAE